MAGNRMIGAYPIIGIRPVIDARRGILDVRGSLEEQTMGMARQPGNFWPPTYDTVTATRYRW